MQKPEGKPPKRPLEPKRSRYAPPWNPPQGASPTPECHRSYLALSVTWPGTETERALQQQMPKLLTPPFVPGALALRAGYVTPRSWEPWGSEIVALPP
eukprot:3483611-Pyramimonas_sp.AAC.1